MIGDHTFGDTMLDRLVLHSHRLTLTGDSVCAGGPPNPQPTTPHCPRTCPDDRHEPKRLTARYAFSSHLRRPIMGREAIA